jgi:tRNA A37 threonylcarbamoyladenosine modification protein TsaB
LQGEVAVSSLEEIHLPEQANIIVTGTGWDRYKEEFCQMQTERRIITGIDSQFPHAADVARLALHESVQGKETDPAEALPQYVRNNVAKKMAER